MTVAHLVKNFTGQVLGAAVSVYAQSSTNYATHYATHEYARAFVMTHAGKGHDFVYKPREPTYNEWNAEAQPSGIEHFHACHAACHFGQTALSKLGRLHAAVRVNVVTHGCK